MYAVVSSGGKQYRVEAGSTLEVERLAVDAGASITFDRVLLVGDGDEVRVGTPLVDGATVSGTVLGEALGPKLVIFKFKQKVKYRRKNGHRQHLTRVRIDAINAAGASSKNAKAAKATDAKGTDADAEATAPAAEAEKAEKPNRAAGKPAATRAAKAAKAESAEDEAKADGPGAAAQDKPKARRARNTKAGEEKQ